MHPRSGTRGRPALPQPHRLARGESRRGPPALRARGPHRCLAELPAATEPVRDRPQRRRPQPAPSDQEMGWHRKSRREHRPRQPARAGPPLTAPPPAAETRESAAATASPHGAAERPKRCGGRRGRAGGRAGGMAAAARPRGARWVAAGAAQRAAGTTTPSMQRGAGGGRGLGGAVRQAPMPRGLSQHPSGESGSGGAAEGAAGRILPPPP
ncbi:bcl-2-binding component 3, isoforms 3/4-like [Melanerpes formicivorus]|uniref:bcl-2-binding component 3, isoforms 3/4-like n=1 Tax=Melanerpes formicivorus TaxID=211600 RepID=UPI00359029EB